MVRFYPSLAYRFEFFSLTFHYRDVAAGIAILLEAGGLVTTANPPEDPETAPIEDVRLGSRLYLAIRWAILVYHLSKRQLTRLQTCGAIRHRNRPRDPGAHSSRSLAPGLSAALLAPRSIEVWSSQKARRLYIQRFGTIIVIYNRRPAVDIRVMYSRPTPTIYNARIRSSIQPCKWH